MGLQKRRGLDKDPFPSDAKDPNLRIPCALLHSADIRRYVNSLRTQGRPLFNPFYVDKLKSASYEVQFRGVVYIWDMDGQRRKVVLGNADSFDIPKNGIVFVQPDVQICIPDYLALRFNLRISLVHRGLLLGTGPLVDPGFEGKLLIPVHNLTNTAHRIKGSDGFIWIEITKVSTLPSGAGGDYVLFPEEKKNLTPEIYFERASGNRAIQSSIPSVADDVAEMRSALKKQYIANWAVTALSVLGIFVGFGSLAYAVVGIWRDTNEYIAEVKGERAILVSQAVDQKASELTQRLGELEREVAKLKVDATVPRIGRKASAP